MPGDSFRLIGSLHRDGASLELKTVDLCFLVALYTRANDGVSTFREALAHMTFQAGQPIKGAKIDIAFVGSCTNGQLAEGKQFSKIVLTSQRSTCSAHRTQMIVRRPAASTGSKSP